MIHFKNQLAIVKFDLFGDNLLETFDSLQKSTTNCEIGYFHKTGKINNLLKIYASQKNGIKQHLETERMKSEKPHWHYDSFIAKELPKQ